MENIKEFFWGAAVAALLGFYAYRNISQDNKNLESEIRKQKVEYAQSRQESMEFVAYVAELEKANAHNYTEIADTTKRYSAFVIQHAKDGRQASIDELVQMHRTLDRCSQQILENQKDLFGTIKKYCEPEQEAEEF